MKKIAVLAGDGIGPEIMAQALKILTALKLPLEFEEALVGGVAYAAFGHPLPAEVVELAKKSDAVLLGAVGGNVGNSRWYDVAPNLRPEFFSVQSVTSNMTICLAISVPNRPSSV